MKKVITFLFLALLSLSSFAVDIKTQCHTIVDEVDRDYCHRKRMQILKKEISKDQLAWPKTLSATVKKQKQDGLRLRISQKQAQLQMLTDELKIDRAYESALTSSKTVSVRKKKKKKKRSDLEKALNIRL